MSENTGILQVPVAGKSTDNDPQKLVYVHVPKNKDATLSTTFTLTKSTKLSGGSLTFSSHSAPSSPTNKVRPPILGNKFTISPTIAKTATNISYNPSKSIKVSLNSSRSIGGTSTPTVFRAANTGSSNFISQGSTIPLTSRSTTGVSQIRSNSIVSQVSTFKSQKPVLFQSKILSNLKGNSQKVVAQKMMPVSLAAKQTGKSSTLVSYGKILPHVVNNNNGNNIKNNHNSNKHDSASPVNSGIKRDHFGTPKREGGCLNSFTPPPLILQSGSNAKKLGNKKACPATISIVTGKTSSGTSSFNFYPLTRNSSNNSSNCAITSTNKGTSGSLKNSSSGNSSSFCISPSSSSGNYKIVNGLVDATFKSRDACDNKTNSSLIDEDLKSKLPDSTTFFKKVNSSINKQIEQKDILQEAMTVSDLQEVTADGAVPHYRSDNDSSTSTLNVSTLPIPLVNAGLQNKNHQSLSDSIPIIFSKNVGSGCPTPVLLQGTLPLPSSGSIPVTVHNVLPVKVQSSSSNTSSHFSSQMHREKQGIPGLIIRTDTVTVRRKVPGSSSKEEDRKESTKPDLSIIPILRNNSTSHNTSVGVKPAGQTSVQSNSGDSVENRDIEHEKGHEDANNTKISLEEDNSPLVDDNKIAEVKELLNWENGTGSLVGSELKFKINEFNAVELVEDEALEDIRNQIGAFAQDRQEPLSNDCNKIDSNNGIGSNSGNIFSENEVISEPQIVQEKTPAIPTQTLSLTPTKTNRNNPVHVHHARKPNLNNCRRDDESIESDTKNSESKSKIVKNPNEIFCCKNCGCYGLSPEFLQSNENNFCTVACSEDYSTKEAEWIKEKQKIEKVKQNRLKKTKSSEKEVLEKLDSKVKENDTKDPKEEITENKSDQNEEFKLKDNVKDQNDSVKEQKDVIQEDTVEDKQLEEKDCTGTEEAVDICSTQSNKEDLNSSPNKFNPVWQDLKTRSFSWVKYLEHCGRSKGTPKGSPLKLWSEPFPFGKNLFKTGMKLEGIDPQHQSLFCVMTVVDIVGHRIRLHFDGYSDMYDFWCNANSPNIFHTGWCEKNGRKLETPPGIYNFTWKAYLEHCKAIAAPKNAFATSTVAGTSSNFRIGMKLEAEDRKNGWTCVATVSDVLDNRILVHFDGWDKAFDTWFEVSSPFIHPVGYCSKNGSYLYPPKDYSNIESFNWHEYLQETNSTSVPARAFKTRLPKEFKIDMKLEAVDKRNPMLVRVATIIDVKRYKLLLHFDGWPDVYDFWVDDDSPDIHPPTWCSKSGHPLQPPLTPEQCAEDVDSGVGCGTQGCKGYGHVKGLIYNTHHTAYGCPYSLQNLNKDWEALLPDRLEPPKEKKKGKNTSKNFINLDASKPVPEESDESQKKRVRKRRKFFDELSPPEGISKPKISKVSSTLEDLNNKNQAINGKAISSSVLGSQSTSGCVSGSQTPQTYSQSSSSSSAASDNTVTCSKKSLSTSSSNSDSQSVETLVHQSIFNPGYHPNPPPPVPHTVDTHKHIVASVNATSRLDIERWRPDDVCNAISKIPGCEISSLKFMEQVIDGEALLMLTQNDLVSILGIKLGPAIKIMSFVFSLRSMP